MVRVAHTELLQSAFWLLLLTAEAATRVLDRVSELEGFYIDANDGFRQKLFRMQGINFTLQQI